MRIAVFTSNAIRHKYLANTLARNAADTLVISECRPSDAAGAEKKGGLSSAIEEHFRERFETERRAFSGNDIFIPAVVPMLPGEASLSYTHELVKRFKPDMIFCFGSSILKERIISLVPSGRFVNLHLGLSPYYRGSGTNFWPFVNAELGYVGSTILHIDAGIDTGDIIAHVRPAIEMGDNVHTVGCKVIKDSVSALCGMMKIVERGGVLNRVKQWKAENGKYYKSNDFNEDVLLRYRANLANGLIEKYLVGPKDEFRIVPFQGGEEKVKGRAG